MYMGDVCVQLTCTTRTHMYMGDICVLAVNMYQQDTHACTQVTSVYS